MDQLSAAVHAVTEAVGQRTLGVYLSGSSVQSGLRPASDLDLLVVVDQPLDEDSRTALVEGLLRVSGRRTAGRPLECTVVVHDDVVPWRYPPTVHLLFGEWLIGPGDGRVAYDSGERPDLALAIDLARRQGRVLAGRPAAETLPAVPPGHLLRAARDSVPGLLEGLLGDERNVLLTFARVWMLLETGQQDAKDRAAEWAAARLSATSRPVVLHSARLYRECSYAQEWWPEGARERASEVVDEILSQLP